MKKFGMLISAIFIGGSMVNTAAADTEGNVYLGFGLSSLALDSERVVGVPTRSPGHTPKIGSLFLGYQFNDQWSVDLSYGADMSNNVHTNQISVNG